MSPAFPLDPDVNLTGGALPAGRGTPLRRRHGQVALSEDVLDWIDEIVPPGTEINPADNYPAAHPALEDQHLRRR
jgi:hypothetical protein